MENISQTYQWRCITPDDDAHYFFGYYDRNPWNADQTLHLCLRVPQCHRLPLQGEGAEIGVLDGSGSFQKLTETRTWCPQQGCMELFPTGSKAEFLYNDYDTERQQMVCRRFRIGTGIIDTLERPIYCLSPDGKWAATLDFSRIPRRGYSYADAALSQDRFPADLDADGLWLTELATGKSRLIVTYKTMLEKHPFRYSAEGQHIWLNHIIFNCDSTRLLCLFRQCPDPLHIQGCCWQTFMYTCDLTGKDAECILPEPYWTNAISHQIWGRTPHEILVDAKWCTTGHEAVVLDESRRPFLSESLSKSHGGMAHMVCSPDGHWILADSYPQENQQKLILINADNGSWEELGRFRHQLPPGTSGELRCDLHPRWSPDGKKITVDTIHSGKRRVWMIVL